MVDFKAVSADLLSRVRLFIHEWLPGGRLQGKEYCCSNLRGGNGDSLKVNVETGEWCDFADPSNKGGDLVSLWAAISRCTQMEAVRSLRPDLFEGEDKISQPPVEAAPPSFPGNPTASWCYRSPAGDPLFHVVRYDIDGKKNIVPYSWSETKQRWVKKGFPEPRPLYGLDLLEDRPADPVLIVEGEKACEAARKLLGRYYVVVTWPNGAGAVGKANWNSLNGRDIVIWPDADAPGEKAALDIAKSCTRMARSLKILHPEGKDKGWDAADALAEGMDEAAVIAWAKPRVKPYAEIQTSMPTTPPAPTVTVDAGEVDKVSKSSYALWDSFGIAKSHNGQPVVNIDNVIRVFDSSDEYRGKFWFDTFHQKIFTNYDGPDHELSDVDWLRISAKFQREFSLLRFNDDIVRKAITVYASQFKRSEPKEWMDTLKWDGTPRLEGFFTLYLGAEDSAHVRAASKNWWVSMAARIYDPGCQVDSMVILEGRQGTFKTSALRIIGGAWYTESHESVMSKDFYQVLAGKLVVEIAEMDTFTRAETATVKKIVTCKVDRYRESYGRLASDHPRQCVFVGTTNDNNYLKDATGARRFWPIKIHRINLPLVQQDRDQLFAEAVHRFKAGESWWEMPEETTSVQESRRQHDEWESIIHEYLQGKEYGVTLKEISEKALALDASKLDVMTQRRMTKIMRLLNWDFTMQGMTKVWKPVPNHGQDK